MRHLINFFHSSTFRYPRVVFLEGGKSEKPQLTKDQYTTAPPTNMSEEPIMDTMDRMEKMRKDAASYPKP